MASEDPVRVIIGSGEGSILERKTLVRSQRRHSKRSLDLHVFNGTHNAIEHGDEAPIPAPLSLRVKYRNRTASSLYRYLIPELCDHKGSSGET